MSALQDLSPTSQVFFFILRVRLFPHFTLFHCNQEWINGVKTKAALFFQLIKPQCWASTFLVVGRKPDFVKDYCVNIPFQNFHFSQSVSGLEISPLWHHQRADDEYSEWSKDFKSVSHCLKPKNLVLVLDILMSCQCWKEMLKFKETTKSTRQWFDLQTQTWQPKCALLFFSWFSFKWKFPFRTCVWFFVWWWWSNDGEYRRSPPPC